MVQETRCTIDEPLVVIYVLMFVCIEYNAEHYGNCEVHKSMDIGSMHRLMTIVYILQFQFLACC